MSYRTIYTFTLNYFSPLISPSMFPILSSKHDETKGMMVNQNHDYVSLSFLGFDSTIKLNPIHMLEVCSDQIIDHWTKE